MLRFQNDYSEGAHPNVLRALCDTNLCSTPGYGLDDDCRRAADAIRARFACPDADVHFLVGGTQTNQLAAAAFLRPWEAMVAADTGHINVHETGAIEATGHKVIAVPGADGKLTPAAIADAAAQHCAQQGVYDEHMVLPRMAYISDTTELGTVYTKAELTALLGEPLETRAYDEDEAADRMLEAGESLFFALSGRILQAHVDENSVLQCLILRDAIPEALY